MDCKVSTGPGRDDSLFGPNNSHRVVSVDFYLQRKLVEFDSVLNILGAYVGPVDGYVCASGGVPGKAVFRARSCLG